MKLSRTARHAIKLLDRQFQRAIFLRPAAEQRSESPDLEDRLHSALPEGVLVANDQGASVILKRCRKNFAGRRALSAGQDNHRPAVSDARIWIARDHDVAV